MRHRWRKENREQPSLIILNNNTKTPNYAPKFTLNSTI